MAKNGGGMVWPSENRSATPKLGLERRGLAPE